jgi:hypothetical protein
VLTPEYLLSGARVNSRRQSTIAHHRQRNV